jgi:hypothetical protein
MAGISRIEMQQGPAHESDCGDLSAYKPCVDLFYHQVAAGRHVTTVGASHPFDVS